MSTHTRITCPGCQAPYTLRLTHTGSFVCLRCATVAVIDNVVQSGDALRTAAPMPDDLSFVQLGTTGTLDNEPFEIIGRIRLQLRNDYKNFWCAVHKEGRGFWLAESFGSFAVFTPTWHPYTDQPVKLRADKLIPIPDGPVRGDYVERCESLAFLGELMPWNLMDPGWFIVQGSKTDRTAIFITKPKMTGVHYLLGRKIPVEKLSLANTLAWNEWS
jgi:hypothetical protein